MTVMAAERIPAGATIFYSYTEVFMTTNLRRLMLFTGAKNYFTKWNHD